MSSRIKIVAFTACLARAVTGAILHHNLTGETIMQNVETKVDGTKLTIIVDLSKTQGASKSGKSVIITMMS